MPFSDLPLGTVVQPCPLAKKKDEPTYWIEVELVGEDDQPIPWEEYEVILPDRTPVKGYLDKDGFARLEQLLTAGTCLVSFPNLDREAWQKIAILPEKGTAE
jgi:hypothetical protein